MTHPNGRYDPDRPTVETLDPTPAPSGNGDAAPTGTAEPENETRVLVDSPEAQQPAHGAEVWRASQRRPVIPAWMRSWPELTAAVRWVVGYILHKLAYHALRVPVYLARLLGRVPRGMLRLLTWLGRWAGDAEGLPLRQAAAQRADAELYLKLSRQRDARVRLRGLLLGCSAVPAAAVVVALLLAPSWARWLTLAGTLAALGLLGTPADRPLLDTAVVKPQVARLTSERVVRALSVLGLGGITQALSRDGKTAFAFPAPIVRDGPGWRAEIDLPPGVTVGEVADRRDKLASGLGRPLGCVWPEAAPEIHPGRLVLWVGDQDMAKVKQPAWPLAKHGAVDLFKPFPFGTDQRGRPVTLTLMFASMVIGAIPRMGKTFALRLVLLGAALDVRAELHAYDLKGTGDLSPLEPICHRYRAGDEDDDIAYLLADFRELQAEMRRRTKVIRELPRDLCPENKITPELASNTTLGLHPIVIGVDECQRGFEHPTYGAELADIAEDLIRRGPAVGVMLVLATQRPDAKSLPGGISGNAVLRYCLKVMGQVENDMVLGTSAYKNGIRATMFTRRDLGIGILSGEGDDPQITRSFFLDGPASETVITRARAARERAGRLTGHALGEQPDTPEATGYDLLADVLAVVPASEAKVWNETVVSRLAELRPDVYAGWVGERLTEALKPYGVSVGQIWGTDPDTGEGRNRRGFVRADVAEARAERDRKNRNAKDG